MVRIKEEKMFQNPYVKKVLSALTIVFLFFILLNLTFLFDFLLQSAIRYIFRANIEMTNQWFPPILHIIFISIIVLISWLVSKSNLKEIYKIIYLTVPVAVTFVTIGMFLYRWPILSYGISALILGVIMVYFYITKKTWLYYYTVIIVVLVLLMMGLLGGDI